MGLMFEFRWIYFGLNASTVLGVSRFLLRACWFSDNFVSAFEVVDLAESIPMQDEAHSVISSKHLPSVHWKSFNPGARASSRMAFKCDLGILVSSLAASGRARLSTWRARWLLACWVERRSTRLNGLHEPRNMLPETCCKLGLKNCTKRVNESNIFILDTILRLIHYLGLV